MQQFSFIDLFIDLFEPALHVSGDKLVHLQDHFLTVYTALVSWTDHVRNEEVLLRVNEQRNILHEIIKRKANWIGDILCRNCLLKQVIEGKIKGQEDKEEGVKSYWTTLRTGEGTVN